MSSFLENMEGSVQKNGTMAIEFNTEDRFKKGGDCGKVVIHYWSHQGYSHVREPNREELVNYRNQYFSFLQSRGLEDKLINKPIMTYGATIQAKADAMKAKEDALRASSLLASPIVSEPKVQKAKGKPGPKSKVKAPVLTDDDSLELNEHTDE